MIQKLRGWFKISSAAEYVDVTPRTLRKWLREGLSYSKAPSGAILIKRSNIDEFLESFEVKDNIVENIVKDVMTNL